MTFLTLYKSLIRPLLEYGNTVWKPYYKKDSEALEKVQRRATKLVPRIKDLPYPSRLKILQLPTLIYRRRRADMLQVYQIMTGMDKVEVSRFFTLEGDGNRRGHRYKLFKPRVESKVKSNSLSIRVFFLIYTDFLPLIYLHKLSTIVLNVNSSKYYMLLSNIILIKIHEQTVIK